MIGSSLRYVGGYMSTNFRPTFLRCLGVLTILGLPTAALADAVPLVSGGKTAGTVQIVGDTLDGLRSVVIDNSGGLIVTGVSITFPKNVLANCKSAGSCTKRS